MASADNGYYKLSWGERIVMDKSESANVKVSDLWMELVRNRPLRVMEDYVRLGAVKSIGVSNFNRHHLDDLLAYAEIRPVINQIEVHPF